MILSCLVFLFSQSSILANFLDSFSFLSNLPQSSFSFEDNNSLLSFELSKTFPVLPDFELVTNEDPNKQEFSSSHCFASSMQFDAWRTTSCIVNNLCFNTSSKELLYYSKDGEDIPDYIAIGVFNYVSYSVECIERH